MKVFIIIMAFILELNAVSQNEIMGKWYAVSQTTNSGTLTIEKEDAFIKDLRIEGSGIWKVWNNTLVAVVNKVKVPSAGEVYLISQKSLENLSETFKRRFKNEPIRVMMIESINENNMIIFNEKEKKTHYKRQY